MGFDRRLKRVGTAVRPGIVHLGPGAFFRAFNAVYTQDALDADGGDWGIVAVSLKSTTARDQLAPQGHAFTSVALNPHGQDTRVITSISDVLVAPEDPQKVIDLMAAPSTRIVSLTITEKGYGYDPATGGLDRQHPDIAADFKTPETPRTVVGLITAALKLRWQRGQTPFTVLSCDNLPSNGKITRAVVLDFAGQIDSDLHVWIAEHVLFPSTMVDRITPATADDDLERLSQLTGYDDKAAVFHEPFRQWVIEDAFSMGRPNWEAGGAQFVESVDAHELMKLRCLNGTHSALAYLGYLAGFETIADAVANSDFSTLCQRLWKSEIVPTIPSPKGEDLNQYTAALLERYKNPSVRHRTWQIAMDGSQKLPQRILGTIQDNLDAGHVPKGLCLVVAAWMRYVAGVDEKGQPIDVRDPLADRLKLASDGTDTPEAKVASLLAFSEVFDPHLVSRTEFVRAVTEAYRALTSDGARKTVNACVSG